MTQGHSEASSPADPLQKEANDFPLLLDERSHPSFREVFGRLISDADEVYVAVARIRLSGVNLQAREVQRLRRFQVLTVHVNAQEVSLEAEALARDPARRANLTVVHDLVQSGRLRIRASPLGDWAPDFSVFGRDGRLLGALVGPHWFQRPFAHRGPALASLHGPEAAARIENRFRELWEAGHDVADAVLGILRRSREGDPSFAERRSGLSRIAVPVDRGWGPE